MKIRNIEDLASYLGTKVDSLEHDVYKYTACGAWIRWDSETVTVGSIVEGSDAEFSKTLAFPFESEAYEAWISELETLTDEAWTEANCDTPEDIAEELRNRGTWDDFLCSKLCEHAGLLTEYIRIQLDGTDDDFEKLMKQAAGILNVEF